MDRKKELKVHPEKIQLQVIRPLTESINIDPTAILAQLTQYRVMVEVGNNISIDTQAVKILIKASFRGLDMHAKQLGINGEFACEFVFVVEHLSDYIMSPTNEAGSVVLHGAMAGTLIGICYSTFRGMVFTRSQNILPKAVILPVVDPLKLNTIKAKK
jgi:hypothetical protein